MKRREIRPSRPVRFREGLSYSSEARGRIINALGPMFETGVFNVVRIRAVECGPDRQRFRAITIKNWAGRSATFPERMLMNTEDVRKQ